ncbi:DUF4386 domain-containing protein [Paenibacillus harenae]|uniref:DUF4386 domain-containing protein n=1 Tax=Paenibacillus harenae TaxID=306543 RepID=UPI0027934623|nr:DUF4386 domain-containing protein [Paenibacillus harenae]MDQ0058745.1 hypothetical protein [Paenibacillus harenae]
MIANRGTARIIGALFLISTAAYMIGNGQINAVLSHPEYLARLYPDRMKVHIGLFLELINAAAVLGIAIYLFPVLKKQNESISLGYLCSRIIESALLIGSITCTLILLTLSEKYVAGFGNGGEGYFLTLGTLAMRGQYMTFELAMLVLSLGSIMFCYLLYRTRLVPRLISLLGIVGYIALLASGCLGMIGIDSGYILYMPGGMFELIFPLWLIVKGFSTTK